MLKSIIQIILAIVLIVPLSNAHPQPVELGKVHWHRDFDKGLALAEQADKPIFLLFQEVPGCSTCQHYGKQVLSHPLIVEAIETLFVPVAIFNNKRGADKKVLDYYKEPSWNNPVVRIVDAQKNNVVPRLSGNYTPLGVVQSMVLALKTRSIDVPSYLRLLEEELTAQTNGTETAVVSMYCFWTGEKNIGKLDGVVETQAGWMNGREVVKVAYDPTKISYDGLITEAKKTKCADQVFTNDMAEKDQAAKIVGSKAVAKAGRFRLDAEPKFYLSKSVYQYLPMTQLQAARANSLVGQQRSPENLFSPRQLSLLAEIKKSPNKKWTSMINEPFVEAWQKLSKEG